MTCHVILSYYESMTDTRLPTALRIPSLAVLLVLLIFYELSLHLVGEAGCVGFSHSPSPLLDAALSTIDSFFGVTD